MTTHPLNQRGCDPFRIAHGFIRRHGEIQVPRMDPMEGTQIGPKHRAGTCTGTDVHFMSALFVIIARPLVPAVADSGMARMAPPIGLPLIVESCLLPVGRCSAIGAAQVRVRA